MTLKRDSLNKLLREYSRPHDGSLLLESTAAAGALRCGFAIDAAPVLPRDALPGSRLVRLCQALDLPGSRRGTLCQASLSTCRAATSTASTEHSGHGLRRAGPDMPSYLPPPPTPAAVVASPDALRERIDCIARTCGANSCWQRHASSQRRQMRISAGAFVQFGGAKGNTPLGFMVFQRGSRFAAIGRETKPSRDQKL